MCLCSNPLQIREVLFNWWAPFKPFPLLNMSSRYYYECFYSKGVESDRCPSFSKALAAGKPTPVNIQSTLADGLAVPLVGYNAFRTAQPLIDKMVTICPFV